MEPFNIDTIIFCIGEIIQCWCPWTYLQKWYLVDKKKRYYACKRGLINLISKVWSLMINWNTIFRYVNKRKITIDNGIINLLKIVDHNLSCFRSCDMPLTKLVLVDNWMNIQKICDGHFRTIMNMNKMKWFRLNFSFFFYYQQLLFLSDKCNLSVLSYFSYIDCCLISS